MDQIKATSIAINPSGSIYVIDDKGRLWLKTTGGGSWVQLKLPEMPESDTKVDVLDI